MAWEENPRICLHMQLIAILSRTGVLRWTNGSLPFAPSFKELAEIYDYPLAQYVINLPKERQIDGCHFEGLSFPVQLTFIVDHLLTY